LLKLYRLNRVEIRYVAMNDLKNTFSAIIFVTYIHTDTMDYLMAGMVDTL
jgi:hypothetical protein